MLVAFWLGADSCSIRHCILLEGRRQGVDKVFPISVPYRSKTKVPQKPLLGIPHTSHWPELTPWLHLAMQGGVRVWFSSYFSWSQQGQGAWGCCWVSQPTAPTNIYCPFYSIEKFPEIALVKNCDWFIFSMCILSLQMDYKLFEKEDLISYHLLLLVTQISGMHFCWHPGHCR